MQVGDVVIPTETDVFRSGAEWYTHAIVVSVDPLVIVSEETDMRWSATIDQYNIRALCQAHPDIVERCMRRLEK